VAPGCFISVQVDEDSNPRIVSPHQRGYFEGTSRTIVPIDERKLVSFTLPNGSIEVESWDRLELEVLADKIVRARTDADAEAIARATEIDLLEAADGVRIAIIYPDKKLTEGSSTELSLRIRVPSTTDLSLQTTDGDIEVSDLIGHHSIASVNGSIDLMDVGGDVEVSAINGNIRGIYDFVDLSQDDVTLEAINGSISVELTPRASVEIDASATAGRVTSEFELIDQERDDYHGVSRLKGRLGDGGGWLELNTVNGSIRIGEVD
jgi:hypothetical protein